MEHDILVKAKRHLRKHDPVIAKLIKSLKPFSLDNHNTVTKPNHFHTRINFSELSGYVFNKQR